MNGKLTIYCDDNLNVLKLLEDNTIDLIYIDPPFNTGKIQRRTQISTISDDNGDRVGYAGNRYKTVKLGTKEYNDVFDNYLDFLEPRLVESRRILKDNGSLFLHIDYREVHYVKVLLDKNY
jgi:site-specific DNA-methyltransferase (adenine-specific)